MQIIYILDCTPQCFSFLMSLPTKACSRESSPGTNSVGFSWEVGGFRTNSSLSQQRRGPHLLQSWWYHSWWRKGSKEAFVFSVACEFYFGNPQQTPFWTTISQKGRCFAVKDLVVLFPDPQIHGSSGCRTNVWLWMLSLTRWVFHNLPLQCRAVCLISCARQGLRSLPCSCKVSHKLEETTANLHIPGGIDRSNILFMNLWWWFLRYEYIIYTLHLYVCQVVQCNLFLICFLTKISTFRGGLCLVLQELGTQLSIASSARVPSWCRCWWTSRSVQKTIE